MGRNVANDPPKNNYDENKNNDQVQDDNRDVGIDNYVLEKVNEYIYLGQILNMGKENQTAEIHRSIRLPWAGFGRLTFVLKYLKIQQYQKSKVFNQCMLPVLTYGCQS